jgi:hypothetical protein
MSATESLQAQLYRLPRHIRDPGREAPPPGIEERRLAIYRELFFNNLDSLLGGHFPVIRRILGDAAWKALVREFMIGYRATTPLFPELGREFLRFLEARAEREAADPDWLRELAHYEWVELALSLADSPEQAADDAPADVLQGIPRLDPLAWPLAYRWPVHRLGPDFLPESAPAQPTCLLVRRDADLNVRFSEISALTYRLLQRIGEQPGASGGMQLAALANEAGQAIDAGFLEQGRAMLQQLRDGGALRYAG